MKNSIFFLMVAVLILGCKENPQSENSTTSSTVENPTASDNAQIIIDESIDVSGGEKYLNFSMEFTFRDRVYISKRKGGDFEYKRITKDSVKKTTDIFSNNTSFIRLINNENVAVADTLAAKIENSINSVNYFVLLPYGLNDAAVNKSYLEKTTIKEHDYHKIKVTFNQEGGGSDFEDVYIYWVNSETKKVDYLAYSYKDDDEIGMRFREANNERYIGGIRFVDYNNFKPKSTNAELNELDDLFLNDGLELLSKIETENIVVNQ